MITIAIPFHHPVTLIARRRKYLFARLLLASGQTLVVELRKPAQIDGEDVIGVVFDNFVELVGDRLAMMTVEFHVKCVAVIGYRIVRLEATDPQRVLLETRQPHG
jgi:hypothetical protein